MTPAARTSPVRVLIGDERYQVTDARRDVVIERSLLDVWRGRPGVAGECMNARCIIRNAELFPHPVLATSVIKSRVYVIDRPGHVVRYVLGKRDQDLVASHDEESIAAPGTLTLQAPRAAEADRPHRCRRCESSGHTPDRRHRRIDVLPIRATPS